MPELGKKVFFLYPPSVVTDELVWEVVRNEYEVYLLKDHARLRKLLPRYNDSILFVNIDAGLSEEGWEEYIRDISGSPDTANVRIGILTYNRNEDLARKYLMDIGVQAGFVTLSLGLEESSGIILRMLEANEARGRRRYVRARIADPKAATFNVKVHDTMCRGVIHDISSVGMACSFEGNGEVSVRSYLTDMQLRLRGQTVRVSGVVSGVRSEETRVHVIIFDPRRGDAFRTRLRHFVHQQLSRSLLREMEALQG
ncbi:MAG: PilZ domain-containing protein [Spirochaetaceae bacterium]